MQMLVVLCIDLLGMVYFQNCMVVADDVEVASPVLDLSTLDVAQCVWVGREWYSVGFGYGAGCVGGG